MKKYLLIACGLAILITGCNGGGGSSSSSSGGSNYSQFSPYPFPESVGSYDTLPDGFASAIPSFVTTAAADSFGLQIAWGYNTNPAALNLAARVEMTVSGGSFLCSATPIQTPSSPTAGTWLIGAAHCFVNEKTESSVVSASDLLLPQNIHIFKGFGTIGNNIAVAESATVFILNTYCQGATFDSLGLCPNFAPDDGVPGGQGNDIALIHINEVFNPDPESSPQIVESANYPTPYTMAPVLSLGYGINNSGGKEKSLLFYVVNYFYEQADSGADGTGYHYLYNSYFNTNSGSLGYSALICGGDSGGGDLFWTGTNWILLSEHTYGPANSCGQFYTSLPNGATNVSAYYNWLMGIINAVDPIAYCNDTSHTCVNNG